MLLDNSGIICGSTILNCPSISERLKERKLNLEDQLNRVSKALEALEKNPEVASIIETINASTL